jgi:acyl-CoA reductase-like NAD-dependent aldehyde dehydrogenase
MMIGGIEVGGESEFSVINPATEREFANAPACSPVQLDLAMDAASQQRFVACWHI